MYYYQLLYVFVNTADKPDLTNKDIQDVFRALECHSFVVHISQVPSCKNWSGSAVGTRVTCLTTDAYLTADPVVASSIPAPSNTFLEIYHEMISTVIILPSESFKKGF